MAGKLIINAQPRPCHQYFITVVTGSLNSPPVDRIIRCYLVLSPEQTISGGAHTCEPGSIITRTLPSGALF